MVQRVQAGVRTPGRVSPLMVTRSSPSRSNGAVATGWGHWSTTWTSNVSVSMAMTCVLWPGCVAGGLP